MCTLSEKEELWKHLTQGHWNNVQFSRGTQGWGERRKGTGGTVRNAAHLGNFLIINHLPLCPRESTQTESWKRKPKLNHLPAGCICVSDQLPASQRDHPSQARALAVHESSKPHAKTALQCRAKSRDSGSTQPRFKPLLCCFMTLDTLPNLSDTQLPHSKVENCTQDSRDE